MEITTEIISKLRHYNPNFTRQVILLCKAMFFYSNEESIHNNSNFEEASKTAVSLVLILYD